MFVIVICIFIFGFFSGNADASNHSYLQNSTFPVDYSIKINGYSDFKAVGQTASRNVRAAGITIDPITGTNVPLVGGSDSTGLQYGFWNETGIRLNLEGQTEYGGKYGIDVINRINDFTNRRTEASLYVQGKAGRLEFGMTTGAAENMRIGADTIAKGSGGIASEYIDHMNIPGRLALYIKERETVPSYCYAQFYTKYTNGTTSSVQEITNSQTCPVGTVLVGKNNIASITTTTTNHNVGATITIDGVAWTITSKTVNGSNYTYGLNRVASIYCMNLDIDLQPDVDSPQEWRRVDCASENYKLHPLFIRNPTGAPAQGAVDGVVKWYAERIRVAEDLKRNIMIKPGHLTSQNLGNTNADSTVADFNKYRYANKLSYYTPDMGGLQFGVSYTPDINMNGNSSLSSSSLKLGVGHMFDFGVSYIRTFGNFGIAAAATGQLNLMEKTSNLSSTMMSWEVGLNLSYLGMTIAGSYGFWYEEPTAEKEAIYRNYGFLKANQKYDNLTMYYTLGLAYEFGGFGLSVTHFRSNNSMVGNYMTNAVALEYKFSKGLMPYVEFIHTRGSLNNLYSNTLASAPIVTPPIGNVGIGNVTGTPPAQDAEAPIINRVVGYQEEYSMTGYAIFLGLLLNF